MSEPNYSADRPPFFKLCVVRILGGQGFAAGAGQSTWSC